MARTLKQVKPQPPAKKTKKQEKKDKAEESTGETSGESAARLPEEKRRVDNKSEMKKNVKGKKQPEPPAVPHVSSLDEEVEKAPAPKKYKRPKPKKTVDDDSSDGEVNNTPVKRTGVDVEEDRFQKIGQVTPQTGKNWPLNKEVDLCRLWEEEENLYMASHKDHHVTEKRQLSIARIAAILKMNAKDVDTHIRTLRTAYSKIADIPSGSGADRLTARQREIQGLCGFLYNHIQSCLSISNLERPKNRSVNGTPNGMPNEPSTSGYIPNDDADSTVANEDQPRKLQVPRKCLGIKRKVHDIFDADERAAEGDDVLDRNNNVEDDSSDSEPRYFVSSKKNQAANKRKRGELVDAMDSRSQTLQHLTTSVDLIAKNMQGRRDSESSSTVVTPPADDFDLWARLLPAKLRHMDQNVAERFKLFIDTKALDAIDGTWEK